MSHEEEITAKGRMAAEYAEIKQTLAMAEGELRHLGQCLSEAGRHLLNGHDPDPATLATIEDPGFVERIRRFSKEAADARSRRNSLQASLKSLGILD